MKPKLLLVQQIDPPTSDPWRFLELIETRDGIRTRVCAGIYRTREEAEAARNPSQAPVAAVDTSYE